MAVAVNIISRGGDGKSGLPSCAEARTLGAAAVFILPRMNWLTRRTTLKLGGILALLAGGVLLFLSLQPDELSRYKARLAAEGEELSLQKLLPPYSKEAVEYHQRLADAAARLIFTPIPPSDIALMTNTTNGFARAAWRQPVPTIPSKGTWEDFAQQMEASETALAELRRLLAAPVPGNSYDPTNPMYLRPRFDFISRRKTAQTLSAAVVNALHHQRLEVALTNLNALIALARFRDGDDLLVGRMIQVAIAGLGVSATWEALQAPGWTDAPLASLQSAWQPLDLVRGFEHTAELERAFGVAYYEIFRASATERRDILLSFGGGQGLKDVLYENIYLPIWAAMWSRSDELNFLQKMEPLIVSIRRDITNGHYHGLRATFAEAMRGIRKSDTAFNRFRYPVAAMVIPNWEKAVTALLGNETHRQMALAAIALKRHQLRHGTLPASLEALSPSLLAAPPMDWLAGRPVRYTRVSDQRFTLHSAGADQIDQRGAGDDLLWPEPELE
jgi:hypothetical protein